ncbi:MAG: hypothetical protein LBR88_10535 [Zoogloeaceae bacterium]|nr:hypothetical protein [Zoogloeaceae bacterium]
MLNVIQAIIQTLERVESGFAEMLSSLRSSHYLAEYLREMEGRHRDFLEATGAMKADFRAAGGYTQVQIDMIRQAVADVLSGH